MPPIGRRFTRIIALVATAALVAAALYWSLFRAPPAQQYGQAVRLLYLHIPAAINSFAGFIAAAGASALYLARRRPSADALAFSTMLTSLLMATLMLAAGMLFARLAWQQWWDFRSAKLITSLLMWLLLTGYFLLRNGLPQGNRRRRVSAAYCLLSALVVPLVYFSNRVVEGDIHQRSTSFDHPDMTIALVLSILALTACHALLAAAIYRRRARNAT